MNIDETRAEISALLDRANIRQLSLVLRIVRSIVGEEVRA